MKLALGTVQFGLPYGITNRHGQVPLPEVGRMMQAATTAGIDTLDTASTYGSSEAALGQHDLSRFRVVTKLAAVPDEVSGPLAVQAWVFAQVEQSLSRLKVPHVDGLLLHRPQQLLAGVGRDLALAMQRLKADGLVKKIGISIYGPEILEQALGVMPCDLIQAPFNLIDRRLASSGWLARLHRHGVEVHVRSVFLQGLLLAGAAELPEHFGPWRPIWQRWEAWKRQSQISSLAGCLAFASSYSEISKIVVGAESVVQLSELLAAYQSSTSRPTSTWPDLASNDEALIDPSLWKRA